MTSKTTPYHVYAEDGYESAHRTEAAAIRQAKRAAKLRGVEHRVVRCSPRGYTGCGEGTVVWSSTGSTRPATEFTAKIATKIRETAAAYHDEFPGEPLDEQWSATAFEIDAPDIDWREYHDAVAAELAKISA